MQGRLDLLGDPNLKVAISGLTYFLRPDMSNELAKILVSWRGHDTTNDGEAGVSICAAAKFDPI